MTLISESPELTLLVPTPQNVQTHSNNSSAKAVFKGISRLSGLLNKKVVPCRHLPAQS